MLNCIYGTMLSAKIQHWVKMTVLLAIYERIYIDIHKQLRLFSLIQKAYKLLCSIINYIKEVLLPFSLHIYLNCVYYFIAVNLNKWNSVQPHYYSLHSKTFILYQATNFLYLIFLVQLTKDLKNKGKRKQYRTIFARAKASCHSRLICQLTWTFPTTITAILILHINSRTY